MSTTSFLAFALLVVLITLSLSQPGKAIPNSADADPERAAGNAEAHRDISLVRKQLEDVLPINLKRQLAAYNGTYNETYNGTKRRTHSVASGQEKSVEYIEVTADDGTPFATSIYNEKYHPDKAFKILGASRYTYWCSSVNPQKPVYLGFIFKTPQCVTKIKFLEQYPIPSNSIYQVFASNNKYNCQNPSGLTILASDTADVFAVGKEFENKDLYYCYGLIVHDHSKDGNTRLIAVKRLQFGVKAPPEPKILKVFQFDGDTRSHLKSNLNALMEYVRVTLQSGTAHASSTYGTGFEADKAFEGDGYWCSVKNPDTPVRLWFQFKEPKRVVQIKFEEQHKMSGEDGYEVFGSDAVGECGGPNKQIILTKAAASAFVTGKKFKNERLFYCYGIQTDRYGSKDYVSAKNFQFGFEDESDTFVVYDWKLAPWVSKWIGLDGIFAEKLSEDMPLGHEPEGIQVLQDGIYFIYSNMNFGGRGSSCRYFLKYGSQSQKCEWIGLNDATGDADGSDRSQPCSLGFSAELKDGDVVKMHVYNGEKCKVDEDNFKRDMRFANMGLIKLA